MQIEVAKYLVPQLAGLSKDDRELLGVLMNEPEQHASVAKFVPVAAEVKAVCGFLNRIDAITIPELPSSSDSTTG